MSRYIGSPGGLDSRDLLRSRSRTSFVSRLTYLKCRDYPSCQDQLFFSLVQIFKIKIFLLRFIFVEIFIDIVETFKIYQEFLRFLDIIKTFSRLFRDFRLKNLDKLRNLDPEM